MGDSTDLKVVISQKGTIPVYTTTRVGTDTTTWGKIMGSIEDQHDLVEYIKQQKDTFVFEFDNSQSSWTVLHNLGKYPSITVVDSAGSIVRGDYEYPTENTVVLKFNAPFKGVAYLN